MTTHVSARLAWHMDGWNGHVCANPASNTYCVGPYSYPGTQIADLRDLEWESREDVAGRCCAELDGIPPCMSTSNAFATTEANAFSDPPDFFNDQSSRRVWPMPPATVAVWPYEEMYEPPEVKRPTGGYDSEVRLRRAKSYFEEIEDDRSLIFYYANYSNPFSEADQRRYAVVGMSRVKSVAKEQLFYENTSHRTRERFGGYVWQRNITSHYPDEGLRLPYHAYLDQPELLDKFLFVPDNPRNFKYGTRHISDDDALVLVERFLEVAGALKDMGDSNEDWDLRISWLQSLIGELWASRGLYPGLPKCLDFVGFEAAIPYFKDRASRGEEQAAKDAIMAFLEGEEAKIPDLALDPPVISKVARQWRIKEEDEVRLLRDVLPRIDLSLTQIERLLGPQREAHGIRSSLDDIGDNPYILGEQYVGDDPDDIITFHKVDHGQFPAPNLGPALIDRDDARRLRGLCVEQLKREQKHTFLSGDDLIHQVSHRLSFLPEWKRAQFVPKYLSVDEDQLSEALTFRVEDGTTCVYLRDVYDDERAIEREARTLANASAIQLKFPVTQGNWTAFLYDPDSELVAKAGDPYGEAIAGQVAVCQRIFTWPIAVLSGEAGTGKTTVIRSLIQAIEKAHGSGTSLQLLAPTGKATERMREATGKSADTIHSFLARRGWLNDNFTFKRSGGQREDGISTYIIDEASMLSLELTATLFRAINWSSVQRVIFVGDPHQLPPIGRGRIFADVIDWLLANSPDSVGMLETNVRQMENRALGRGTAMLDLASLYVRPRHTDEKDERESTHAERVLQRVQEGGDVDKDLRVLFWSDPEDLRTQLLSAIVQDMERDTGMKLDPERRFELWKAAFTGSESQRRPEYQQVITPYRGEEFGTDALNAALQEHANGTMVERVGVLGTISYFDKVIQFRNRPRSNQIWAYRVDTRSQEQVEVFNGQLGFTKPHGFDKTDWQWQDDFWLRRFQVEFTRQLGYWVGYGRDLGKANGRWLPSELVEENLELAYAISVHKAQGSEFERVYFVLPKSKQTLLSPELFYTGITRAQRHCTLLVEDDVSSLLTIRRPERSHLAHISSSLFQFRPVPSELQAMSSWYEEGLIHRSLADIMVRSKSEVIIANLLFDRDIPFRYEVLLRAPDGTFYLPDFTLKVRGEDHYWEHVGRLDDEQYRNHWETKEQWYEKHFPGRLVVTYESGNLSHDAQSTIENLLSG